MKNNYFLIVCLLVSGCSFQPPTVQTMPTYLPSTPIIPQTIISTFTPLPTLNPEESEKKIAELMQTNGNCVIPCFWGISPNVNNFSNAIAFIDSLGREGLIGVQASVKYYNTNYMYKNEMRLGIVLLERNDLVQTIKVSIDGLQKAEIDSTDWLAFRPDKIIENYGTPSAINVGFGEGQNGFIGYQLLISYDNPSFHILYTGEESVYRPAPILHACPSGENKIGGFELSVGSPFDALARFMYPINQVSNLSTDEFSETLVINQEEACFDFDLSLFYK